MPRIVSQVRPSATAHDAPFAPALARRGTPSAGGSSTRALWLVGNSGRAGEPVKAGHDVCIADLTDW